MIAWRMKNSESGVKKANRQCWECLKRRLVCDHTLPHCKKCQKSGKECPGYDDQKPLQWLQPGKVNSRRREKDKTPPKIYTAPKAPKDIEAAGKDTSSLSSIAFSDDEVDYEFVESQIDFKKWTPGSQAYWGYLKEDQYDKARDFMFTQMQSLKLVDRLLASGGGAKIEEVVSKKMVKEAAKMLRSKDEPLKELEEILTTFRAIGLPSYKYLSSETSEVVQAVYYYNARIHPEIAMAGELAPNPAIILFPPQRLHLLPPPVHHTLVCLSLNHFNQRLPSEADRAVVAETRSKIFHHRGAAIRALSEYVSHYSTRCSDLTIVSIMMFMSMDLQNAAFEDWRAHAQGIQKLVKMRGGLKNLRQESPHLLSTLIVYIIIVVLANTSSPSWNQLDLYPTHEETIEDLREIYSIIFPYTLCPPELFFEILHVSNLRRKISTSLMLGDVDPAHEIEAYDLLARIEAFVPEDWAQPGAFYDEWLLLGTIFQASLALYCMVSLQSLAVLPNNVEMIAMRSVHGDRLLKSLNEAMEYPRLMRFIVWPLVVAGVEAAYHDESRRSWIDKSLTVAGRSNGTSAPLKAKSVLRHYWQKGEWGWDECFGRAYIFIA